MTFLLMLLACSLLIEDAVQLDPYMSSFENFDLKSSKEKRYDYEYCDQHCNCPTGPPLQGTDEKDDDDNTLLKDPGRNANLAYGKRTYDTAPLRGRSTYGLWQRDGFNYPSTAVRYLFN